MASEDAHQIQQVADAMRGTAAEGLRWAGNEYDRSRYENILALAARLTALSGGWTIEEALSTYRANLQYTAPQVTADAAIFDERDRILLILRPDTKRWATPGGICAMGEAPARAAIREALEEIGAIE